MCFEVLCHTCRLLDEECETKGGAGATLYPNFGDMFYTPIVLLHIQMIQCRIRCGSIRAETVPRGRLQQRRPQYRKWMVIPRPQYIEHWEISIGVLARQRPPADSDDVEAHVASAQISHFGPSKTGFQDPAQTCQPVNGPYCECHIQPILTSPSRQPQPDVILAADKDED